MRNAQIAVWDKSNLLPRVVLTAYDLCRMQQNFERRIVDAGLYNEWDDERFVRLSARSRISVKDLAQACVARVLRNQRDMIRENASVTDAVLLDAQRTRQESFERLPDFLKAHLRSAPREVTEDMAVAERAMLRAMRN